MESLLSPPPPTKSGKKNSKRTFDTLQLNKNERSSSCFTFLKTIAAARAMTQSTSLNYDLAPPGFYQDARDRLETFENSCLSREYINDLVAMGIYRDALCNYKCAYCSLYLKKLDARRLKYHEFSTCPIASERLFRNEALRKLSFRKFKTARARYRDDGACKTLAKNGFYYYGKKIEIRCSFCKVKLNNDNNAIDDVHGHHSPNCHFNAPSAPTWEDIDENIYDDVDYKHIYPNLSVELGVAGKNNDDAISIFSDDKANSFATANVDDIMCKICFERERDTCFLPCRHVSTCSECAKRCKVCCICREKIKNKLEIYLQ
ncbi:inhibitor of apoptosis-2 [Alphabaculovirus altersperidaniae]|uniref:Inhibitor of apoptosis-2 n=1 Tax=Spodoptera eridania nucleopolyhedrovirus TaxID=2315721 RepID=A0ABX6TQ63_9ABAC|nr:inhibitor of apoptosis-2 [Spodoptera eridania nucleopolyhedrovirus]QNV47889.1 inhibitor of apoptosis-2 [Spodoptera eridania nucleopolyhedrovirus]